MAQEQDDHFGLVSVGGVLWPRERAAEEVRNEEQMQKFRDQHVHQQGREAQERKIAEIQQKLVEWGLAQQLAREYLSAIQVWKQGWMPIFKGDEEKAAQAQQKMSDIDAQLHVTYANIIGKTHYPADELKQLGFTPAQVDFICALGEGITLSAELNTAQQDLNLIISLMRQTGQ